MTARKLLIIFLLFQTVVIKTGNYSAFHASWHVNRNTQVLRKGKKGLSAEENAVWQKNAGISELAKEKYRLQKTGLMLELKPFAWEKEDLEIQEATEAGVQGKQGKRTIYANSRRKAAVTDTQHAPDARGRAKLWLGWTVIRINYKDCYWGRPVDQFTWHCTHEVCNYLHKRAVLLWAVPWFLHSGPPWSR